MLLLPSGSASRGRLPGNSRPNWHITSDFKGGCTHSRGKPPLGYNVKIWVRSAKTDRHPMGLTPGTLNRCIFGIIQGSFCKGDYPGLSPHSPASSAAGSHLIRTIYGSPNPGHWVSRLATSSPCRFAAGIIASCTRPVKKLLPGGAIITWIRWASLRRYGGKRILCR